MAHPDECASPGHGMQTGPNSTRYQNPSLPSKPEKPVKRKIGKYGFRSIVEHQFHADVRRPSMQEPASKKLSAPLPSNACRKKSARISLCSTFTPPKESMYPFIPSELWLSCGILSKVPC